MRRTAAKLATATVVVTAAALTLAPGSASADLVTHCIGTGGAVTVPNDLFVPAGQSCALTGTTITGNVSVAAGANLVITGGRISGEIQVAADGYLDAGTTDIGGGIDLASGGYGVFLEDTGTGSITVRPKGSATIDSFLFVENAAIDGTVTANAGEVRLDLGTEVTGNVSTTGTYYTDVHDSFVDGTLSVLNSATGSVVCGSAIRGRSTFAGNLGGVQLGPNGALAGCASGGYWGRDVSITNTTGGVTVDDNIIDGKLTTTSNTPAARVTANNRIRGGVTGEQGTAAAKSSAAQRTVADRDAKIEQHAADRTSSAVQEADVAGPAKL
jgi:cytoskeletal protein CcmA (bactofilin family)